MIEIRTIVAKKNGEPVVVLSWGDKAGQLTVTEAREHAMAIMAAADAAESDAFLAAFCKDQLKLDNVQMCMMLHEFREFRKKNSPNKEGSATTHIE